MFFPSCTWLGCRLNRIELKRTTVITIMVRMSHRKFGHTRHGPLGFLSRNYTARTVDQLQTDLRDQTSDMVLSVGDDFIGLEILDDDTDDIAHQKARARRLHGSMSAMSGAKGMMYQEFRLAEALTHLQCILVVAWVAVVIWELEALDPTIEVHTLFSRIWPHPEERERLGVKKGTSDGWVMGRNGLDKVRDSNASDKDKLKEVKACLNFEGCLGRNSKVQEVSQHSESRTPNVRGEPGRRRRSRRSRSMYRSLEPTPNVFSKIRRDRSESPRHMLRNKGRGEEGVFNRLGGGKGKSVPAHSESHYQSSCSRKAKPIPESVTMKEHLHGERNQYRRVMIAKEDTGSQDQKNKSRALKRTTYHSHGCARKQIPLHPESATLTSQKRPECRVMSKHITKVRTLRIIWKFSKQLQRWNAGQCQHGAFQANFLQQKKCIKDPVEIHHIKQREKESTEDFVQRFKTKSRHVKGAQEWKRISRFMHGITNPELTKHLHDNIPKSVDEMMRVTTAFLRGEVAASNQNGRPMIIEAEIGSHFIHRMYIDGGSASEILYEHYFNRLRLEVKSQMVLAAAPLIGLSGEIIWLMGQTSLPVKIRDAKHSTSTWMNFMVVRSPSPYNGIIGRPRVRKIQAVPSTDHEMLKFPVTGRILTLRSSNIILLECTMVSKPKAQPSANTRKPSNMKGVLRHIAEHRLNIHEGCPLVRQKKRIQAPKRNKTIQEEVEKLMKAGIMKEVHYHSWMENSVMVKKHDNIWRMCVDFQDLNKACPKDGYPLLEIDWKVESLYGYPFKCFLDAYKGYHQIKMKRENNEKTTFITGQGIFCYFKNAFWFEECRSNLPTFSRQGNSEANWQELGEAEAAFKEMKKLIAELPTLTAPMEKEVLIVYIAVAGEANQKENGGKNLQAHVDSLLVANQVNASYMANEPALRFRQASASQRLGGKRKQKFGKARLHKRKDWIEEIPHVLWAHRTLIKSSNWDTPFLLTYRTEAVILAKISMPTLRTKKVDMVQNDEALKLNLNLHEEKREQATIREARSKAKMEKYYNSKFRNTSFKPGDLVYRSNDASHAEDKRKLGPK
nr:reverse transcriptase domain-containing protein [Tanacetum cinerariifolium]